MPPRVEPVDYRELSSFKPLFLDYLHRFERLAPFFAGDPFAPASWNEAARRTAARPRDGAALASILEDQQRRCAADEAALASVARLGEGALAVVTGQQVGLFGGPLYTLYKALSAVRLARRAAERLGRPVVPLFWMDADDHDFDEIRRVHLVDGDHELVSLAYEGSDGASAEPVGPRRLDARIEATREALARVLPPSEFREEILAALGEAYRPGRTLAEAFGAWLCRMTRGTGLAVVDPTEPALKAMAAPLFEREAVERSESGRLVAATTAELLERGYHEQAAATPDTLNLFYAAPERFHIAVEGEGFRLGPDEPPVPLDGLLERLRAHPERFSPNVLLRPLYQDTVLPTMAYVAGPNELAYFAQLRRVYEHFGVPMPLVVPRASLTILERAQAKFLARYGVRFTDLRANDESILNRILKEHIPPALERDLGRGRLCVGELMDALERDLRAIDSTLVGAVRSARGKIFHQLGELEAKALRALKRKDDTLRRQFHAARTVLFPDSELQERRLSPVQYLAKYGWAFSEIVRDGIDVDARAHLLVEI